MALIACIANSLVIYMNQFISPSGAHLADYVIPLFARPALWIFSTIFSAFTIKKIKTYRSLDQKILTYAIFLFCTPIPQAIILENF